MDCLFCKIINRQIPATVVYEDETVFAFNDIDPKAPVHILVVPKQHIANTSDVTPENAKYIADIFVVIAKLAKELNLDTGYRVVTNEGVDACQTVDHLHFHLLAKRTFEWPAG